MQRIIEIPQHTLDELKNAQPGFTFKVPETISKEIASFLMQSGYAFTIDRCEDDIPTRKFTIDINPFNKGKIDGVWLNDSQSKKTTED